MRKLNQLFLLWFKQSLFLSGAILLVAFPVCLLAVLAAVLNVLALAATLQIFLASAASTHSANRSLKRVSGLELRTNPIFK